MLEFNFILDTGHCAILYDAYPNEPSSLTEARMQVKEFLANLLAKMQSIKV